MDDLVLIGAAGIIGLFLAAVILLYGAYSLAGLMVSAYISGEYSLVLIIGGIILIAGSGYMASGVWLRKTNRI